MICRLQKPPLHSTVETGCQSATVLQFGFHPCSCRLSVVSVEAEAPCSWSANAGWEEMLDDSLGPCWPTIEGMEAKEGR